jgi:uncharacterized membrane protein YtjA (UPF0391 family)
MFLAFFVARPAHLCRVQFRISLKKKDHAMLHWALMFLIVALVAGVLGFGVIAGTAAWVAKVLFLVFLVLFIVSMFAGGIRRPSP